MRYEDLNCGDHTCPFNTNGKCKFDKFADLPCDLSDEEFEEAKIFFRDNMEDKGEF